MTDDSQSIALDFALACAERDYAAAYALTTQAFRSQMSEAELQSAFEDMIPLDWGAIEPIEVAHAQTNWSGKGPGEVEQVYVSLGGDIYSEALWIILALEDGSARVNSVQFGRP